MRAPRACYECRQSKRKCVRVGFGECCNPCRSRRLACSLETTPQDRLGEHGMENTRDGQCHPEIAEVVGSPPSHPLGLPRSSIINLVELYLRRFHGGTHSIFHPNTLRAEVRSGKVSHGLLAAICALGCKFSSLLDRQMLEGRLVTEAKRAVKSDLENVCLENIQACILLTLLSAGESQASSEATFIRMLLSTVLLCLT